MNRVLLFGGAFDPPHLGHERLLENAVKAVVPDITIVAPTEVSPHKKNAAVSFFDRAMMAETFKKYGDNIVVSGIENTGKKRKSYTFNTVKKLKKKYHGAEIFIVIGNDMVESFEEWYLYRRLCAAVTIVTANRSSGDNAEFKAAIAKIERMGGRVVLLDFEPIEVSSTELRRKLKAGEDTSGLLSEYVAGYAAKRNVYKPLS